MISFIQCFWILPKMPFNACCVLRPPGPLILWGRTFVVTGLNQQTSIYSASYSRNRSNNRGAMLFRSQGWTQVTRGRNVFHQISFVVRDIQWLDCAHFHSFSCLLEDVPQISTRLISCLINSILKNDCQFTLLQWIFGPRCYIFSAIVSRTPWCWWRKVTILIRFYVENSGYYICRLPLPVVV